MGIKSLIKSSLPPGFFDAALAPFVYGGGYLLRFLRRFGLNRMPLCRSILFSLGVFPLLEWYYDPMFNPSHLRRSLREDRKLDAIDFDVEGQLSMLSEFDFSSELLAIPGTESGQHQFHYANEYFGPGDSEYLYNMIRRFKPRRMIEIGSGFSTLMAKRAMDANRKDDPGYFCEYTCIEPFESGWLEEAGFRVLRQEAQDVDIELFKSLREGDFLFIDSSHMIRPQGDVLYEFLEILPALNSGVFVHVHDICTPKDYLDRWIYEDTRFWNEQYLLEAFLSFNNSFRVTGALNFLKHHYPKELGAKCPVLVEEMARMEPTSFWMVKTR